MGTLFSALDIARSGLQVAQVQLDTAGHNIANVNKPGFSRQRVELISRLPVTKPFGQIGRGVEIADVVRVRDAFLDGLYRREASGLGDAKIRAEFLQRIEDVFLEPGEHGLSFRINNFHSMVSSVGKLAPRTLAGLTNPWIMNVKIGVNLALEGIHSVRRNCNFSPSIIRDFNNQRVSPGFPARS